MSMDDLHNANLEIARLTAALVAISNPLEYLKQQADQQGKEPSPQAYSIANDLGFVQGIARQTLAGEKCHVDSEKDALREALKWALPLAERAVDNHRLERLRYGHDDISGTYRDGQTWEGIYQDEVDQIETARDALK